MTSTIWNDIEKGIRFENSGLTIPWGIAIGKLTAYGQPYLDMDDGQYSVVWQEAVLLNGINGAWHASYRPHEDTIPFKSIGLFYTGDDIAQERYNTYKKHLLALLGAPQRQEERNGDKEMSWKMGSCFVRLYLFDMHVFNCALDVGVK